MKTLEKLFKIFNLMEENNDLRLQDIANILNLDKSTVHRFLKSALKYNFLRYDYMTNRYNLGLRFLNIGMKLLDDLDIVKIANPILKELVEVCGETVHLTIFDNKSVVYLDKVECQKPVRMYSRIGNTAPFYCTAVGKVVLAYQEEKIINEIISKIKFIPYTKNTISDKKTLIEELKKIRENGYAVDNSEHEEEICCIAGPIIDHIKRVNYSVSISAVKSRMSLSKLIKCKDILIGKCNVISSGIGFLNK